MSAFAVFAVGFTQAEALNILLVLTVVAVIASFGWGWLNDRIGPKRTLLIVLATWAVGLGMLTLTLEPVPFLVAGALLGAGLGGVAVTDRLLLFRLTPAARIGESLGVYGLVGKLSALIGLPLYTNIVATLEPQIGDGAYQIAIASLLVILAVGVAFLIGVPEGRAPADEADIVVAIEPAIVPPAEAIR
jgi:MFS transporter, UMF1 family